jgi:phosphoserine phosphatase
MPVLATLVVDPAKAPLSDARLDEVTQGAAGFERWRWLDEGIAATMGLKPAETLAVGDGANDLAMLDTADLGVAYRAKPKVAAVAHARIDHGDLTARLFAQGITRKELTEG